MGLPRPTPLRLAPTDAATPPQRDALAFERLILSHLDAAHNLAWWLMQNADDARDVVQDACLHAWRAFPTMRADDGRAWLLAIVRNQAYSKLRRPAPASIPNAEPEPLEHAPNAELFRRADAAQVRDALEQLAPEHREVLVLCDLEGLTYSQLALVIDAPVGTVMSRLARARTALRARLAPRLGKE